MTQETSGQQLKKLRTIAGLTLRQVEETTGVSNAYLSQLENDKIKKPSVNVLYKLAGIYGVHIDVFLAAFGLLTTYVPVGYFPKLNVTPDEEKRADKIFGMAKIQK